MPKICANKCEGSLKWEGTFPDHAVVCMFCNGPLIYNTGQSLFENTVSRTYKEGANEPLVVDVHQLEQNIKVKLPGEGGIEVRTTERVTEKTSTHGNTTIQPPTQKDTTIQPPTQKDTTIQPPTQKDTTIPPPTQKDTTIQPPTQKDTTIQPPTQKDTTIPPPTQEDTTIPPTTQKDTTIQPPTQKDTTIPPPTQEDTTIPPPTQEDTTIQPPTQKDTTIQPPTQKDTTIQPTTQMDTTIPPPTQKDTTIQPPTQKDTTIQPPTQKDTTIPPPTQEDTTIQPPTQKDTTIQPPTQKDTTIQPTTQMDTTIPPPTQKDTTIQPPTQKDTTIQPTTQMDTTIPPPTQEDTTIPPPTQEDTTIPPPTLEDTTIQPPTQEDTTIQPPTQKDTTIPPPTQEDTTIQPPTQEDTTIQPTTQKDTTIQPPTQKDTTIQPTTQMDTTIPPPTQEDTTIPPPTQEDTTIPPPTLEDTTIQPPTQKDTTIQPPTQKDTTIQPPTQEDTTIQPPTQKDTTIQPPTQEDTTIQPPTQEDTTIPPPTQEDATIPPPTQEDATIPPHTLKDTTIQPPTQEDTTIQPPTQEDATIPPPTQEDTTIPPPTLEDTTIQPPTLEDTTIQPPTLEDTTIQPPTQEDATIPPPPQGNTDKSSTKGDGREFSTEGSSSSTADQSDDVISSDLEPNNPDGIIVQFHTIVPMKLWLTVDRICLRTGYDNFSRSYCPFTILQEVKLFHLKQEFNFAIITGTLRLPLDMLKRSTLQFPYKYYFQMKEGCMYESLHHYLNSNFNRHFIHEFPKGSDIKNATLKQFDLMILPELEKDKQSIFKRITSLFSNQKGSFNDFKEINVRRFLSLQALLPKFLRFGCLPESADHNNLDEFLETFIAMVQKLTDLHISPLSDFYSPRKWDSDKQYTIRAREFMVSNYMSHLFQLSHQNIDEKLICVYFAIILIDKLKLKDNNLIEKLTEEITGVLQDLHNSNLFAFEYIKHTDLLHTAMCEFIFVYPSHNQLKFFRILTFYHQIFKLTDTHTNFLKQLDYTSNEFWGFPAQIKINRKQFSSKVIEEALELSHHNPILPYSILYHSLESYCLDIFSTFHSSHPTLLPLSAFVSLILIRLSDKSVERNFITKLIQWILSILTQPDSVQKYPPIELEQVFRLTLKLSSQLIPTRLSEELFYLILELLARSSTALQGIVPDNITLDNVVTTSISNFVKDWHNEKVLKFHMDLSDYKKEMNFWDKVISFPFPDSLQWSNSIITQVLESILKTRNVSLSEYTNLFIHVHDKLGECMKAIFLKEMIDRLKVSDANSRNDVVSKLKTLDSNQCTNIGIIFSSILLNERDKFLANRLVHFLEWPTWGHYFELYSTKSELIQHISHETKSLLETALDTFLQLIKSICTYQIRIEDATHLSDKQQHFLSLAQLVLATKSGMNQSIQEIENAIRYCISATGWIQSQLKRLKELEKLFGSITAFNIPIIQDFLAFHLLSEIGIADFVEKQDDNFYFVNQPEINTIINSKHLQPICDSIQYLINSVIFLRIVDDTYLHSNVKAEEPFSFVSFCNQVWIPTIGQIGIILNSSCDQSILLSDVDRIFDKLRNSEKILIELKCLSSGYHQSQVQPIKPISKLPECSSSIALYFTLHRCDSAATKLLQVRDTFSIERDFQLIDDLKHFRTTFPNKPLSTIDKNFTYIVQSLIGFTNELNILDSILDKFDFIKWVRDNMHDLNDLKTFVEIALTTSSGDGAETDRIMILHSVCTNFAPIIFYINKDTTYDYLIERCREVFKVVNTNTQLLDMLDYASKSISFWEELKRSQGSLEEGALMQLEKIVSSGMFHISTGVSFNPMQMVSLTIETVGNMKSYGMEQLRDLKSKLTLVVGKSDLIQSAIIIESHKNASKFNAIFDLITELASIISELAEIGNMRYSNYTFSCSLLDSDRVVQEIEHSRNCLTHWKLKLEESRKERYYLNFYTISQLVLIQKGLRAFIEDSDPHNQEELYHLLGLLNPDVNRDNIQTALRQSEIHSCKSQTKLTSAVSPRPTRFHSVARSGHCYSFIGGKTVSRMAAKSKESVCEEESQFPDHFTRSDREVGEKIHFTCDFPFPLIIEGMKSIQHLHGVVTEHELIKWCVKNAKMDSGTSSGEDSSEDISEEREDASLPVHTHVPHTDSTLDTESEYIDMLQLGTFLEYIRSNNQIRANRELYTIFKVQEPNLIFVPSYLIYESVLSLYLKSPRLPLPYASEVLLCSELTKLEEIDIFWRRVISKSDCNHLYLFCLVGVDNLQYETAVQAVNLLRRYLQLEVKSKYKLVIICSEEGEERSYMAAALENYRRPSHVVNSNLNADISNYLLSKLIPITSYNSRGSAWVVDREKSRVRLVVSNSVGAGKTLYIRNLGLELSTLSGDEEANAAVTVVIHGKQTSEEHLTEQLLQKDISRVEHGLIFHVDIASTVQLGIESIMFKLLVLGYVCKGSGELWCCRGRDYYVIETTVDPHMKQFERFTQLFPTVRCTQPIEALNIRLVTGERQVQVFDKTELGREEFQRTFAYLKQMEAGQNLDSFRYDSATFHRRSSLEILQVLLKYCGIERPSWTEMKNFVTFLSKQLSDCDNSYYCLSGIMGEEWMGFKSFVVKFLIYMSRDFATPSLRDDVDNLTEDLIQVYEILKRRKWENSSHPYIFFNPDRQTMTFLGFLISDQGHLYYSENPTVVIEANILQPNLMKILQHNKVNLNEDYQLLDKAMKIEKLAKVMEIEWLIDPDPDYVLTLDNMRKILAILMRFRCNIPVVVMGETGCGKTRLIQFMCALQAGANNLLILKVHGGTTERDVMRKVREAEELARDNFHNHNIDTVLFFDEANTSPAIGLIKEIMCDRRMYGRHISSDIRLQFIAACNPYRRHTKEMLHKLSTAGLGFFTKSTDTTDRLGDIPLRELVYRVMELPASMRPLVWDFGQLSNDVEKTYTREIVAKHLRDHNSPIEARDDVVDAISEVLAGAQNYMRERNDECSFVSLRDVERTMRVMLWFYEMLLFIAPDYYIEEKEDTLIPHSTTDDTSSLPSDISDLFVHARTSAPVPMTASSTLQFAPVHMRTGAPVHYTTDPSLRIINGIDKISYSLILAVAVCYRARLQVRSGFDRNIADHFKHPLTPIHNYRVIDREIDKCQQNILEHMTVGEHIAKNKALKENVFMMFVCIELKIPLFVIGKPGSSKSLAKTIISNNMQGNKCQDGSILKNFKQVHIMSYQCSQLATAEGIIGVFKNCRNMQRKTRSSRFVCCVVLDEVGLAEDSPLLPLKVLHPLLEDSSYGAEDTNENSEFCPTADYEPGATRDDVDREHGNSVDQVAFIGISNWSLDPAKMNRGIMVARGDPDQEELLSSANEICRSSSVDPTLLDSILPCIPNLAKAYLKLMKTTPTKREYYGLRDFYSLIKMLVFLCNVYKVKLNTSIFKHCVCRNFGGATDNQALKLFSQAVKLSDGTQEGPECSPLGLIRANLSSFSTSFYGETRYLLLLTENYSALNILLKSSDMWPDNNFNDIRVIFGSNFPRDQEYSTVCRNINKIKVCMETGKTVILLNLENLYESLYDALNQYYMKIYNQRYVDLGLGTHRMKCRVHVNFKLIVIADKETVYTTFPTPLINRLEKHFLSMSTVLSENGQKISKRLAGWANEFSTLDKDQMFGFHKRGKFTVGDCFIGFHDDTPPSIVFHVMKEMYPDHSTPDIVVDEIAVLERCQTLLLRMATTDAVLRVKNSLLSLQSDNIIAEYFKLHQSSLEEYLRHVLSSTCNEMTGSHLTLATTHSRLLTDRDVDQLRQRLSTDTDTDKIEIVSLSLQQFQTELQYTREIQSFLRGESGIEGRECSHKKILLVQCERGADNAKLIACARHKTVDELKDWREEKREFNFEVCLVFLIQLSREVHGSKFVSFCGGEWNTVHIDDIRSLNYKELPPVSELIGKRIYQLFEEERTESGVKISRSIRLQQCVQSAVARLVDMNGSEKRTLIRLQQFIQLMERNETFSQTLCQRLIILMKEQFESSNDLNTDWLLQTANCGEDIQSSGTFRKAINLRINNTITPLLAELIACLDRNGNLELALYNEKIPDSLLNLWQDIFRDERLLVLQYKDIVSPHTLLPRRRVPMLSDGAGGQHFQSDFPFSSLIRGFVQDLWKQFSLRRADKTGQVWSQFEGFFNQTTLGRLINCNLMPDETDYNTILRYLMDFIHMNRTLSNQHQYNIYESVILLRIDSFSKHNSDIGDGFKGNILSIPNIHCAYEDSKQLLDLLQEAFVVNDHITERLFRVFMEMNKTKDVRLQCLELVLVEEIVASCSHTRDRTVTEDLAEKYITEIRRWEHVVERGLSFSRPDRHDYTTTVMLLRAKWNRILTVELFVSQCILVVGHTNTQSSINILFMILTETPDFTCVQTIKNILDVLSGCLYRLPGGQKNLITRKQKFRECATKFFISILTRLTFKSLPNGEPGPELVELLMGFVMLDEDNMRELEKNERSSIVLFKRNSINPSLSFKMFLMQQMIKHRRGVFEDILSNYLAKSLCDFENNQAKKELYMIIVQSIEDSLHQDLKRKDSENQIQTIHCLLKNDFTGVCSLVKHSFLPYSLLDMIATLRFVCTHISHWITHCYNLTQSQSQSPDYILRQKEGAIIQLKNLCLMYGYENLHVFLLKNIYHQLGSDTFHLITENRVCSWIIPDHVMEKMCESQFMSPDYFMIYGDNYAGLKYSVEQANVSQCKDSLLQYFDSEKNNLQDIRTNIEYFLFSIFQIVSEALKRSNNLEVSEEFITLRNFLNTDLSKIQDELLQIGLQILSNNFGNRSIEFLQLSPNSNHHISLSRVIYHMAIMLSSNAYPELFSPISLLYESPGLLINTLFPTMMDDQLQGAKQAMVREGGGQWYSCVNGHAYFVGECGKPTQAQVCPDCGIWVGGQDHRVTQASSTLNATPDSTQHGYLLGRVEQRQKIPSSERSLSPASVAFIRALMDLSFIWSSCSRHTTDRIRNQVLPSLVRGGLDDPRNLSNFFYLHLERDVRDIAQLTGKNFEESTFLLHLVIRSLMDLAGQPCGDIPTELTQRDLREQWEREFDRKFIQPILSSLHTDVQRQMEQVLSEKRIANNPMLRIVYEREEPDPNNPLPHLWRYRTIVSVEHFSQSFSTADVKTKDKCPLVDKFLREENKLFVTRYLPDIVQLQIRMREKFLHRLDRREAANTTIKEFLDRIRHENKQEWEELSYLVNNFDTAWSLIGEDVRKNGRLKMEEALEQQEITPATCLAYLLPSSTGEGVLITSLTDYLVLIHNSFVHAYRDRVKESRSDRIPLHELNTSHVIEYEEYLQPLLLSHAHYSLALGQGSHVTYDFEGVEQQFVEQFIQSKPLILAEHLRFEYTREAYNLDVFEQVRHKVQQTELKEVVWRMIREDLDSLETVCDILQVLDVVIGFLSSAGGDPDQKVSSYLYEVLKYPRVSRGVGPLQSRKTEANVYLKHILSFWRFLSIEKARKLSMISQIPFSSLRQEFQEEVSREEKIQIEQSCNYFPVEKMLVYLHDFILFFVRERDVEEKNYGLGESIAIYGEEKDWRLPEGFKQFPDVIKLSQCAAAWAVLARQEHTISDPLISSV